MNSLIGLTVALFAAYMVHRWNVSRRNPSGLPLPPGPPGKPFVGNLAHLPSSGHGWLRYLKLANIYGDLIYFRGLGNSVLSINSYKAANDLLDKKGSIYSDRPRLPMVKEMSGWSWSLVFMSYSEGFAEHRKVVQQKFQPQIVTSYRPIMEHETKNLLKNLHSKPDAFCAHLKRMAGAIIMMITYGHEVTSEHDEFVQLAVDLRDSATRVHGSQIVDILPILKYTPAWFPGQEFARFAQYSRSLGVAMRTRPYQQVRERMAAGTAIPSLVSSLIEENATSMDGTKEELIKNVGGVVYTAGADTTVTALVNFFLAMVLFPEVQEKARRELDEVVGSDRLPQFSDRHDLPYLSALVKEVWRWKPVVPLGVVHCTSEADEYCGNYIPKSTTVIPNIAAMLHDESAYPDPDKFDPERFLGTSPNPDPARSAFGFGRRICPGRFFADDSVFLTTAFVLHTFYISRPIGTDGRPIELNVQWSSGLVAMSSSFPCTIRPRPETEQLVLEANLD